MKLMRRARRFSFSIAGASLLVASWSEGAPAVPAPVQTAISKIPQLVATDEAQRITFGPATFYYQHFSGDVALSGHATWTVEVMVPPLSATTPGAPPAASIAIDSPSLGKFWISNSGRPDCWRTISAQQLVFPSATDDVGGAVPPINKTALDWCPAKLNDWHGSTPAARFQGSVSTPDSAIGKCSAFEDLQSDKKAQFNILLLAFKSSPCTALYSLIPASPEAVVSCAACAGSFGICGSCCDACGAALKASFTVEQIVENCAVPAFMDSLSELGTRDDLHFVDVSNPPRSLLPVVGLIRSQASRLPATGQPSLPATLISNVTRAGDMSLGHLHQLNDWNWILHDVGAFDPYFNIIGQRDDVNVPWAGSEVELEFGIPHGLWTMGGRDKASFNAHGYRINDIAFDEDKRLFLGEVWPNQNCAEFGIDIDDDLKQSNPSFPVTRCGKPEQSYLNTWRNHFGRGLFIPAPMPNDIFTGNASTMFVPDPGGGIGVSDSLDVEDWDFEPHRIGFLGQPILDCGHWPYSTEIHPPQIITMPVKKRTYSVDGDTLSGVEVATFGWSNITVPSKMEFDVWPPPRPNAKFEFVAWGADHRLSGVSAPRGLGDDQNRYGYVIDASAPQGGPHGPPSLVCQPYPLFAPNHVHCVYEDPAAGTNNPVVNDTDNYGNTRMTPYYATSRFELRVFVGWRPAVCNDTECGQQGPRITASARNNQFGGPTICIHGTGFTPGARVPVQYENIPAPCAPDDNCGVQAFPNFADFDGEVDPSGVFDLTDHGEEQFLRTCSTAATQGTVLVRSKDGGGGNIGTGQFAFTTLPAGLWCTNSQASTGGICN
jgi:hypothetical protein